MIRALLPLALLGAAPACLAQTPIELQNASQTQEQPIPRTSAGLPDLSGNWATTFITTTGRMDGATKLVVTEEEARELSRRYLEWAHSDAAGAVVDPDLFASGVFSLLRVNGEYRTSLITTPDDGVQHYTDLGKHLDAEARARTNLPPDGPEMRPLFERCIVGAGSAPLTNVPSIFVRQVVQTADHVVIASDGNDTRIIGVNAPPRPGAITSPLGDSTAFWEGDTLVVHTTGLTGQVHRQIITRPQSRVIERFTLISPGELLYRFTVEDSAIYAQPWSAEYVLHRSDHPVLEYACHEGNYAMHHMLQHGRRARPAEAAAG
jgi:hypothetical protein